MVRDESNWNLRPAYPTLQVRSRLLPALEAESDPASTLALAVPLLYIRVTGRAVVLPGKAMAGLLAWMKAKVIVEAERKEKTEAEVAGVEAAETFMSTDELGLPTAVAPVTPVTPEELDLVVEFHGLVTCIN